MPKRIDLKKILIIGAGPIVIGQGCEFDYSGVQACKALKAIGYEIILVNPNPATIMTDVGISDHTYIEAITWQTVAKIIEIERPDAILSTMGGQTALNCALDLERNDVLVKYNVELIGVCKKAINKAENREEFRLAMHKIGLKTATAFIAYNFEEALTAQMKVGFPTIIRPSYTLGGSGGGIAHNHEEFIEICKRGFALSSQLLIEESLLGWKEFELEVIRDMNDSCIVVCTIENLDPMGIHTGDSITVAPAQTLTDLEYQMMRDAAISILREIGVQTGGANVQFAIHPQTGCMLVIEMNPRVSRSSALASKATGFPIAKISALLAVGYTLDELKNDVTYGIIPASFEPTIDYVVVKIPRFNFEKFTQVKPHLTTQMQAIGEVMAIGSTFQAAIQKALCSLELELHGFNPQTTDLDLIIYELEHAGPLRILYVADAFRQGMSLEQVYKYTSIDPWFLYQISDLMHTETQIKNITTEALLTWKQKGFSDLRIAEIVGTTESKIRAIRYENNIIPQFKHVDSCAAEFAVHSAYLYSAYDGECEAKPNNGKKIIVLGSGPNRIGQGIEFDYCCVQALLTLRDYNIESVIINCNPETVSTDYDSSDRLYFEPVTLESTLNIIKIERPFGVILQLGGQTPLKLANALRENGVNILGTSPEATNLAEDRDCFSKLINKLALQQSLNAIINNLDSGLIIAKKLGYPLILRPSYVLGGRSMQIVHNDNELCAYLDNYFKVPDNFSVLIDRFLENAIEVDVEVIADGQGDVIIAGIIQHIEPAGVHSGDSMAVFPPHTLSSNIQENIKHQATIIAKELKIIGLMNVQFAIQENQVYVLEVNPRASRTIPFISKALGIPITRIAVACMIGKSLSEQGIKKILKSKYFAVKQPIFPFNKFPGTDPILGPEMRSTGEIMAIGVNFAQALQKSLYAASSKELKIGGYAYINVSNNDRNQVIDVVNQLLRLGFSLLVDSATSIILDSLKLASKIMIVDDSEKIVKLMADGEITFVVSTVSNNMDIGAQIIRAGAIKHSINYTTTLAGAKSIVLAMRYGNQDMFYYKLQRLHQSSIEDESCIETK